MTKRITILAMCFMAAASEQEPATVAYPGSTIDVDDSTAGLLVVAGKARYDKEAKLKSTAKDHEEDIEARNRLALVNPAEAAATAMARAMAGEMAKAMAAEFARLLPPPPTAAAKA